MNGSLPASGWFLDFGVLAQLLDTPWFYLATICLTVVALFILLLLVRPLWFLRAIVRTISQTFYRTRALGTEHFPTTGPALLVCNQLNYLDWLFVWAAQQRPIRFIVCADWKRRWGLRYLLNWTGGLPIDADAQERDIEQTFQTAADALRRGELVGIFTETLTTRSGIPLPLRRVLGGIIERYPVPVIPTCLYLVWGSVFRYSGGKYNWKWPRQLPYPVCIGYGEPLSAETPPAEVYQAVRKLSADCAIEVSKYSKPMHRRFVRIACRHPFRSCYVDVMAVKPVTLNYGKALAGAMCLKRHLEPMLGDNKMVGIWLPSSVGSAIANITLALLGKTSVNLNYTSAVSQVQSAIRQCKIRHVLTSRRFVERFPLEPGPGVELIYLEDLREQVSSWERIRSFVTVLISPGWLMEYAILRLGSHQPDELATVVFSSGSTGEPKGIMLTFRSVTANADSMISAIELSHRDRALGILPFFHSFGYTVTLWVPLQVGASAVYFPDPRQAKKIGELCRTYQCTVFLNTPTFLRFCHRQCQPEDFRSVRMLATGAEKLPQSLADHFHQKFGVLPMEAYGCTELSPATNANVPDHEIDGFMQVGNRPGTIGQPLPGIAVKIVDPDTFEPRRIGEEGLLLIYGPNVMKGYLHRDELTKEVIRDGWYVTGDMAKLDDEGFVTITGRLSRFAKVGGEMVPLEKIEDELHALLGTADRVCAVTSVPDESRGERVVVLHVPLDGNNDIHSLCQRLSGRGLPNLWLPAEKDFVQVPELPILGSGKVNLQRLKQMAVEHYQKS